jgi:hypothetical protein
LSDVGVVGATPTSLNLCEAAETPPTAARLSWLKCSASPVVAL